MKCVTCHDTGTFYAATESVWQDWKTGYSHMYEMMHCPCTPRVVRVRTVREYPPQVGGGRREPTKGLNDGIQEGD